MKLIQSRDNALFKQLKRLAESGRERKKTGLTLLDSLHLVEAWETQRAAVNTLIASETALQNPEIPSYLKNREFVVLTEGLMREIGIVDTPSGLLGLVEIPENNGNPDLSANAVLLDGVQDPGNLGSLLRTAAAAGIRQVLLSPGCAAAWSPKVLRAGQGAQFVLEIFEAVDLAAFVARYHGTVAVTCLQDAQSLYSVGWQEPLAWVFGAEGQGVRPELIASADLRLHIPMPGSVESLNVGAAAAVCLFEMVRRR